MLESMDTKTTARVAVAREYDAPLLPPLSPSGAAAVTLPAYLQRHYAWAYVWPFSVWFFDHQPIINAILFGNYRRIMRNTLRMMDPATAGRTLQIAGVYGELTPTLASQGIDDLHLIDAAPIQLEAARRKLDAIGKRAELRRMQAESLSYGDGAFDTALMFLLLHEMPPEARRAALREAIRVLKPGGRFVIAEYGEKKRNHFFHRFAPMRWILTTAEPFLGGFWSDNLTLVLTECAASLGRTIVREEQVDIFGGFYRVARYKVS
jgi:ubiquinone/menaquinone biosynthesis C-methylase UbiE